MSLCLAGVNRSASDTWGRGILWARDNRRCRWIRFDAQSDIFLLSSTELELYSKPPPGISLDTVPT